MKESRWRLASREVISKVLAENRGASPEELRKLISQAYPFGQRKYTPYKLWLDEVKKALGKSAHKITDFCMESEGKQGELEL